MNFLTPYHFLLLPERQSQHDCEGNEGIGITGNAEPSEIRPPFPRNPDALVTAQQTRHLIEVGLQFVGRRRAVFMFAFPSISGKTLARCACTRERQKSRRQMREIGKSPRHFGDKTVPLQPKQRNAQQNISSKRVLAFIFPWFCPLSVLRHETRNCKSLIYNA